MAMPSGMKDPFASPALPRSFYHPTPSKGVDTNVAITGPGRVQELKVSETDTHFLKSSSTLTPAVIAEFSPFPFKRQKDGATDLNTSNRSGDHFHEVWPGSEQPSASSIQVDISPFTSVSAEAETDKVPEQRHPAYISGKHGARHERGTDKTPVKSILQKYIERFRNSEPKSRTERAKEKEANYLDFWWMHSSPSSPADADSQSKKKQPSLVSTFGQNEAKVHVPHQNSMLTKEAVMELDKETSKLQSKADHILTKSQLSLASSGPIVSTQGLGSSTCASDYSLKTDSQAPYRPAFVSLRDQSSLSGAQEVPLIVNYKQRAVSQDMTSPPGDILAKWRLRRKMDEAKTSSRHKTKPMSTQGIARNREMDVRLEEFRQKLLSQRALVTQEDIQYERQKMEMLMEEDMAKIPNSKDKKPMTSGKSDQSHGVDPILVRLKTITSTMETEAATSFDLCHEKVKHTSPTAQNEGSIPQQTKSCREVTDGSIQRDSNVNNASFDSKQDLNRPRSLNDSTWSLNKNNTAFSPQGDSLDNGTHPLIDNMTSVVLCDATKKHITLSGKSERTEDICMNCQNISNSSHSCGPNGNRTEGDVLSKEGKFVAKKACPPTHSPQSEGSHSAITDHEETATLVHGKRVYRQYLEAEKPSVEMASKVQEKSHEEVDGISSQGIERSLRRSRLKKKRAEIESISREEKSEGKDDCPEPGGDKEGPTRLERDTNYKAPQYQKITSGKNRETPKSQNTIKVDPEDVDVSSRQASRVSQTSSAQDKTQMPTSRQSSSRSSSQQNIHAAVNQTITDHLFDGPSVISSVDSWASLFPHSPAPSKSLYDSDLATPSPHRRNASPLQSTPSQSSFLANAETELGSSESDSEFEGDPLLSLLRQQRQDYVKKLEAIESALIKLER